MNSKTFSRYFFIAAVSLFILSATSASAAVLYSQVIPLVPGWNIVSTPKVLESHSFSAQEVSGNFDIFVLNATSTIGWSTMAELGQTEFTPLYGYFINNKTGSNQTLTFNYRADVSPLSRIFERTFPVTGWYSIGIANATYATKLASSTTDTNNPDQILNAIVGYDSVIDFTDASSTSSFTRNSVALVEPWKSRTKAQVNQLSDFRETKGYVIHINTTGNSYAGFQDNLVQIDHATSSLELAINSANYASADVVAVGGSGIDEFDKLSVLAFDLTARGNTAYVNDLTVNFTTSGGTATTSTAYLYRGSTLLSVASADSGVASFVGFDETIAKDATVALILKTDIRGASASSTIINASISPTDITSTGIAGGSATTSGSTITSENFYVRRIGPVFSLVSKNIGVSGTNDVNSTSTITATFSLQIQALGGDIIFGSQASATPMFIFKVYNMSGTDVTATAGAGATTSGFTIPVSGVITPVNGDSNSFRLQEDDTVTISPITITVPGKTPNGVAQNALSVGIDSIRWIGTSRQTSSFMSGKSAWRTNTQSP